MNKNKRDKPWGTENLPENFSFPASFFRKWDQSKRQHTFAYAVPIIKTLRDKPSCQDFQRAKVISELTGDS